MCMSLQQQQEAVQQRPWRVSGMPKLQPVEVSFACLACLCRVVPRAACTWLLRMSSVWLNLDSKACLHHGLQDQGHSTSSWHWAQGS